MAQVGPCQSRECRAAIALVSGWGPCGEVLSVGNGNSKIREQRVLFLGGRQQVIDVGAVGGEDGCGPTRLKVLAVCRLLCADSVAWVDVLGRPSCSRRPPYEPQIAT